MDRLSPHHSAAHWLMDAVADADRSRAAKITEIPVAQPATISQERHEQMVANMAREISRLTVDLYKAKAEVAQLRGVALAARAKMAEILLPPNSGAAVDHIDLTEQAYRWLMDVDSASPLFKETFCSQCGDAFGPGGSGFSHCDQHAGKRRVYGS